MTLCEICPILSLDEEVQGSASSWRDAPSNLKEGPHIRCVEKNTALACRYRRERGACKEVAVQGTNKV